MIDCGDSVVPDFDGASGKTFNTYLKFFTNYQSLEMKRLHENIKKRATPAEVQDKIKELFQNNYIDYDESVAEEIEKNVKECDRGDISLNLHKKTAEFYISKTADSTFWFWLVFNMNNIYTVSPPWNSELLKIDIAIYTWAIAHVYKF